jgi:hypothetical protein
MSPTTMMASARARLKENSAKSLSLNPRFILRRPHFA